MPLISYVPDSIYQEVLQSPQVANLLRILFHSPEWGAEIVRLAKTQMTQLKLSAVARELVILHTSRLMHAEYVWAQHVGIAEQVGLTAGQFAALTQGDIEAAVFTESERLLLRFISDVACSKQPSRAELSHLLRYFTEQELVEAVGVHGFAATIGKLTSVFAVEVDPISGADMERFVASVR